VRDLPRSCEALVRDQIKTCATHWLEVRLDAIDHAELTELVLEAWRMVVPKRVAAAHFGE
jgi:hypothetical protein